MSRGIPRSIAAVIVLLAAAPGAARASTIDVDALTDPATAATAARAVLDIVEHGSPSEILAAGARLADLDPTVHLSSIEGDPIAGLLEAIGRAEDVRAGAVASLTHEERALVLEDPVRAVALPRAQTPLIGSHVLPGDAIELRPRVRALAERIDQEALARAAMIVVGAIERASPALEWIPTDKAAPSGCSGVTGDVVFETSDCNVIIANTGVNTYDEPANPTLLIDLGGDDSYLGTTAVGMGAVEVVIDVAGADGYAHAASFTDPGADISVAAQGFGSLGVGVLADLGGNDVYSVTADATAPQPGPTARNLRVYGQGSGLLGAGVLLDADGADTFTVAGASSGGAVAALGQGDVEGGVGALIDLGAQPDLRVLDARSDRHEIAATETTRRFQIGSAATAGQGAATLGAGLLVDRDGADTVIAHALGSSTSAIGQGAGAAGAGVLLDGGGNDTYHLRAEGASSIGVETTDDGFCWEAIATAGTIGATAIGQGGALVGAGIHLDGAGNDARSVEGVNRTETFARATSRNNCSAFGGNKATATSSAGSGEALGQGGAAIGAAALIDLGGNDNNDLRGTTEAIAEASSTSPGPDVVTATATADDGTARGQGYGGTAAVLLLDVTGDDAYRAFTSTSTTEERIIDGVPSIISSAAPGLETIQGYLEAGPLLAWFLDVGGDDTYASSAGATAASDDACWSNNPAENDGRGRDLPLGPPPGGCP